MATEPRKPRFTNVRMLTKLSSIFTGLTFAGFLGSFLWLPLMSAEWLVFIPGFLITTHLLRRATAWQQAQWVTETSAINMVEFDVLRLRSLMAGDRGCMRELSVTLVNKHTMKLPWVLFTSLGPSELVSYETRVVGGKRKFRNVACYPTVGTR